MKMVMHPGFQSKTLDYQRRNFRGALNLGDMTQPPRSGKQKSVEEV